MLRRVYRALGGGVRWSLSKPVPWGAEISKSQARSARLEWALNRIGQLGTPSGLIVECGVASGNSLAHILQSTYQMNWEGSIVGFDSFEGFPQGTEDDRSQFNPDSPSFKVYKSFTQDQVRQNLVEALGANWQKKIDLLRLVQGWIPDSFEGFDFSPGISLLHIDVDLYQPYRDSLEHLWPLMLPGGIVLFDEYDSESDAKKWPGAKKAIDEFCMSRDIQVKRHWTGLAHIEK